jgi:hypothetical protein
LIFFFFIVIRNRGFNNVNNLLIVVFTLPYLKTHIQIHTSIKKSRHANKTRNFTIHTIAGLLRSWNCKQSTSSFNPPTHKDHHHRLFSRRQIHWFRDSVKKAGQHV